MNSSAYLYLLIFQLKIFFTAKLKDANEKLDPKNYSVKAIQLKQPFLIEELREGTVEGKDLT